jgi:uncharacterized SAM-binding protein YcdF (DUF218 family)
LSGKNSPSRANSDKSRSRNRRIGARYKSRQRRLGRIGWLFVILVVFLSMLAWAAIARELAPTSNTSLTHFDTIIVLGAPATTEGNPSPLELARVTEAVQEYERGIAPRMILTGGPDGDRPVEARVMAQVAEAQGIPESAIFTEEKARDTIQNGCYSVRIMKSHGWDSAEVISSASHLPRAGLIFSNLPIEWRTHAAPSWEPITTLSAGKSAALEVAKTLRYLVWARSTETCTP